MHAIGLPACQQTGKTPKSRVGRGTSGNARHRSAENRAEGTLILAYFSRVK